MILTKNLSFFDKNGHNLNLNRVLQQDVVVTDSTGSGAEIEAITDDAGRLISLIIISGGIDYLNPLITVTDKNTGETYSLQSSTFIKLTGGVIERITLDSNAANFSYPSSKFEGAMFFEEISVGLIENQHIFITEKLFDEGRNEYFYSYPRTSNSTTLQCSFEDENDEEVFLFNIDYTTQYPEITNVDSVTFELQDGETEFTDLYIRKSEERVRRSAQINLGLSSPEEGIYERVLILSEIINGVSYPFAEILLRGETEGEDERFKVLLANFGIIISEQEEKIYRDSDVNEFLPNYTLLNQKRKEMLLENQTIYPYIGSYKALVNIINHFDYYDLGLKEYWLNINEASENYGKFKHVEIPIQLTERGQDINTELLLPKTSFKKTSLFGLFFDINKTDGTYDEEGVPNVVDNFAFTIDEILIKLFALKKYLKNKFLPLNARIVDITGEGIYFERFSIRAWKDDIDRYSIEFKKEVDFVTSPENLYIVDLNDYKDKAIGSPIFDSPETELSNYVGNYLNSPNYQDQENIKVGCPLTIDLDAFDITWDEVNASWDDLSTPVDAPDLNIYTWDNLGQGEFYEMEWNITFEDPKKFSYSNRDQIELIKQEYVILPYSGIYEIELFAYDLNNFRITKRKNIEVKLPHVEFISFARFTKLNKTWDDLDAPWDSVASEWVRPTINHNSTWDSFDIAWDSLDMNSYVDQDNPFDENVPKSIKRIYEKDRKEGLNGIVISITDNSIEVEGQLKFPKLKPDEFVFFKKGNLTKPFKVISTDYSDSNTVIEVENLTSDINTSWSCFREVRGIIIYGNHVYHPETNLSGLQKGDWVSLNPKNETIQTVSITDVVTDGSDVVGVEVDTQIQKYPGEYVMIYRAHEEAILPINIDEVNKTLSVLPATAANLSVGFSIIKLDYNLADGEVYTQRLLVKNIINYPLYSELVVHEIDGDLSNKFTYIDTAAISFKYESFQTRLVFDESGTGTSFNLDFNFYPYSSDFLIGSALNGSWKLDYRNKSYATTFEITNSGFLGEDTYISINDINKLLYLCSPSYDIYWKNFNDVYAKNKFGTKHLNWANFNEVTWDDMDSHLWEQFDYHSETLCGFKILEVAPNGIIRFNEEDEFEFFNIPALGVDVTQRQQFDAAVIELNNSESPSVNKFHFFVMDESNVAGTPSTPGYLYIMGVANNPGTEHLGYLVFENGVSGEWDDPSLSHTYPIGNFKNWREPYYEGLFNKNINWNSIPQTYYIEGTDPVGSEGWYPKEILPTIYDSNDGFWKSFRLPYDRAVAGSFTWNEILISDEFLNVPIMTTVFFKDDNCKIAGKTRRIWRVFEKDTNKLLIETTKSFLIWTFAYKGEFNIELEITDSNGNNGSIKKVGYISTLDYEQN